jgi:transcriptional regulator with XRE-family HTH domain
MKITTDHSASSYGIPVILDDSGAVMDYAPGIKAVREKLNLTTEQLAQACNVSRRTVEGWEQGRPPDAAPLNVMAALLKRPKTKARGRDS